MLSEARRARASGAQNGNMTRINGKIYAAAAVSAALGMALLLPALAGAAGGPSLQDKVKTAFIYKFTKYVHWPGGEPAEEFRIAVIGDSSIVGPLRELAKAPPAEGRRIKLQLAGSADEIGSCHILVIAASERSRLREILKKIEGKSVLSVGEVAGMAARGAVLDFVLVDGRLRFQINRRAAERAGLQISSELLKLAILVEEQEGARDVEP